MSAPEPVTAQFEVDISPAADPKHLLFFDRCSIFAGDPFYELHFGFFGQARELVSGLIVMVGKKVIEDGRESFLAYVKQMGTLPDIPELPECRLRPPCEVVFADFIGLARHHIVGEILLHSISWKIAVEMGRSKDPKPIAAICVGLLRCDLELQKRWILGLYETTKS
jgi:hypothetical protein